MELLVLSRLLVITNQCAVVQMPLTLRIVNVRHPSSSIAQAESGDRVQLLGLTATELNALQQALLSALMLLPQMVLLALAV